MEKYKNIPPKDIQNAIWGQCFDYKDFDEEVLEESVRDRVYGAWQHIHLVIKGWIEADQENFLNWIKENQPDLK